MAFPMSSLMRTLSKPPVLDNGPLSLIHTAPSDTFSLGSSHSLHLNWLSPVILCPNSAHPSKSRLHGITPSKHPLVEWALSTSSTLQPLPFLPSSPLSQTTLYHSYLGSSWLSQPLDSKLLGYGALPNQFVCDPLSKV